MFTKRKRKEYNVFQENIFDINIRSKSTPTLHKLLMKTKTNEVTGRNPIWHFFIKEACKLRHVVQFHRNDTHSYTKEDEEEVPESCVFRRITNNFCILSIQQMWSMHEIKISAIMNEQLVTYVKKNFTKKINDLIKDKCIENNDEEQEKLLQRDFTEYKELALIVQTKRV